MSNVVTPPTPDNNYPTPDEANTAAIALIQSGTFQTALVTFICFILAMFGKSVVPETVAPFVNQGALMLGSIASVYIMYRRAYSTTTTRKVTGIIRKS
jgi:hypothetical protein